MPGLTLSGRFLLWQMAIVVLVVTAVAGVSTVQADTSFRRDTERRMLSAGEVLAANGVIRRELEHHDQLEATNVEAEVRRSFADASYVLVVGLNGEVLSSTIPTSKDDPLPVGEGAELGGRVWTGETQRFGHRVVEAHIPVVSVSEDHPGERIGYVVVGANYPPWIQVLATATPQVFFYLVLGGVIGAIGSVLLSRRVKQQTLGLEPHEIASLVEQREAMLHGVREGVVGVDPHGRISFANDEAVRLLGWTSSQMGRDVEETSLSPELVAILAGGQKQADVAAVADRRVLVLNSMPIHVRGKRTGTVVTMRDRTELLDVRRQLASSQDQTDTLRAQVHEFRNRLHVIAGMVELGERSQLLNFIGALSDAIDRRVERISRQIGDPAVAALLVAKSVRADELALSLELTETGRLEPHSARLSTDLVTVVGNLIDNAFEELGSRGGTVTLDVTDDDGTVTVDVSDTGSGLSPALRGRAFEAGWTSKDGARGEHGWGLALTRMACRRHNGDVWFVDDDRTRFVAELHYDARDCPPPHSVDEDEHEQARG